MFSKPKRFTLIVFLIIFITGAVPFVLNWFLFERLPTLSVQAAKDILNDTDSDVLLVDVRNQAEFEKNHIAGAINWPLDEIWHVNSIQDIPDSYDNSTLLLICDSGIKSAIAVRRLTGLPVPFIYNVRGGIQAWYAHENNVANIFIEYAKNNKGPNQLSLKSLSNAADFNLAIVSYMTKFVYMVLSLVLVIVLWNRRASDLRALFWSMGFFFIGELICLFNYVFFGDQSFIAEYLHSFGMVASIGFFSYSLFEGIDKRVVKYSDANSKCALIGLCKSCIKYRHTSCVLNRLFPVLLSAMIIISAFPLTFSPHTTFPKTDTVSLYYDYGASIIHSGYEIRYCSIMAIVLFSIALLAYILKNRDYITVAKIFTAAALGHLGFGLFRLGLRAIFNGDIALFTYWEETTELLSIAFIGIVLWILREKIFEPPKLVSTPTI